MERRDFIKGAIAGGVVSARMLSAVNNAVSASVPEGEKKKTAKKGLVMYASHTNNTVKVAERFRITLEKNGWQCDIAKISKDDDPTAFPYKIKDYDLVCAGSGINLHQPYSELIAVIRIPRYGYDPLKATQPVPVSQSAGDKTDKTGSSGKSAPVHGKIVFTPESKKCIAFATYGGLEFGPMEVQPALDWINLEMAHLGIKPVGSFCCPGKFLPFDVQGGYYNDLTTRPNEKDLMRAELFIEQILEDIADRPAATT